MRPETTDEESRLTPDELGESLLALHQLEADAITTPDLEAALHEDYRALAKELREIVEKDPEDPLQQLKDRENAMLHSLLGVEAVDTAVTRFQLGRSAIILSKAYALEDEPIPEYIKNVLSSTISKPEQRNRVPTVTIDAENTILINGTAVMLTPAERYIFERLLDSNIPIQKDTIYGSDVFKACSSSNPKARFRTSLQSVLNKLEEAGLPNFAKDAVTINEKRDRDKLMRTTKVEITDKFLLLEKGAIKRRLLEDLIVTARTNITAIAAAHFGLPEEKIGTRHRNVIRAAIEDLKTDIRKT